MLAISISSSACKIKHFLNDVKYILAWRITKEMNFLTL